MRRLLFAVALILTLGAGPATKPAGPKPFTKVEEALNGLPKEARPEKGEWNEFNTPKANQWLKKNTPDSRLELTFQIEDVTIEPQSDRDDPDKILRWNVQIGIGDFPIRFEGAAGTVRLDLSGRRGLFVFADERIARAAKEWKKGDRLTALIIVHSMRIETGADGVVYLIVVEGAKVLQVGKMKIPEPVLAPGDTPAR